MAEVEYKFHPDPEVAAAEARWLSAIADNLGHAAINDRWEVVVRLKAQYERDRGYRRRARRP